MIRFNLFKRRKKSDHDVQIQEPKNFLTEDEVKEQKKLRIRMIAVISILVLGYLTLEDEKNKILKNAEQELKEFEAKKTKMEAEISKANNIDEIAKKINESSTILNEKIESYEKILSSRTKPLNVLIDLSNSIPKDVWLNQLMILDGKQNIKGVSIGLSTLSEFIKTLEASHSYSSVDLKSSSQKNSSGDAAQLDFEMESRVDF